MKTLISNRLTEYISDRLADFKSIESSRKKILNDLAEHLNRNLISNYLTNIIFVCRGNSRRSHLAQIWAQIAYEYYNIENIKTFSGGIKTSSFSPKIINSLERAGLEIFQLDQSENPVYAVYFSESKSPIQCFSKVYFHEFKPNSNYTTVITCSDPQDEWPSIDMAVDSFKITYPDPQIYDNTEDEDIKHDELCKKIACEMFYVFDRVVSSRNIIN